MNKYIWIVLAFLLGCSNSNDVAVTQTGNPPKVSIGISTFNDTSSNSALTRNLKRESNDPHDTISSITITSAIIIVETFELFGAEDSVMFHSEHPYIIDLALDSSTTIIDTIDAKEGQYFDSAIISTAELTQDLDEDLFDSLNDMQNYSMLIKGFVNEDSGSVFEFPLYDYTEIVVPLSKALVLGSTGQQRVKLVIDIRKWFIDENGEILNPLFNEDRDDIEESILTSVSGEEDEHFEEEEEEEE